MARKKVIDLDASSTFSFEKEGQVFEGFYIGFKTVTTSFGPSQLHVFQTEDGSVGVWGSAQLNAKLATIKKGSMTYITYLEKVKVPKGSMKVFSVEFDDEISIDVGTTAINFQQTSEPEADQPGAEEPADVDPNEPDEPEEAEEILPPPPKVAAKAPAPKPAVTSVISPEQKAKAQALLNKQRSKVA